MMNMASDPKFFRQPAEQAASSTGYIPFAAIVIVSVLGTFLAIQTYKRDTADSTAMQQPTTDELRAELQSLSEADRNARLDSARDRLAGDALDRQALSEIAAALAGSGQLQPAENLSLLLAERSLRDVAAQEQALRILLQQRRFAEALNVIDGLIRSRPKLAETLFDYVLAIAKASQQDGQEVRELLAANPPWREQFFARALKDAANINLSYGLLAGLKSADFPPTDAERRLFIGNRFEARDFATAYYFWLDLMEEKNLQHVNNVFDSDLRLTPRNMYFDWNAGRTPAAKVTIVPRATGSVDNVLRADYLGDQNNIPAAFQYLRLAPGSYVLSGEQRAENLNSNAGLHWELRCVEGVNAVVANTPVLNGNAQWSRFDVNVAVPAGCLTQLIALRVASAAKLDQQVSGSAFFDNISLTVANNGSN